MSLDWKVGTVKDLMVDRMSPEVQIAEKVKLEKIFNVSANPFLHFSDSENIKYHCCVSLGFLLHASWLNEIPIEIKFSSERIGPNPP
jgi:hypothetical protein